MRRATTFVVSGALIVAASLLMAAAPAARTAQYHRPIIAIGASQSNNWSGYNQGMLEKNVQFHQISGTWTVPTATQHKAGEAEYSASWIGIGGGCVNAQCTVADTTLIQAGTSQNVDSAGAASYDAWYELIPAPSISVSLAVNAGDQVHVDIREGTPELWTILIQNLTSGQSFSTTLPYASSYATAEWIEETPVVIDNSGNASVGPMPNLSTATFDTGLANNANPNLVSSEAIQLIDLNGQVLATPSSPDSDTDGFNDCSYATSCTSSTS
jgi:Peptidase A4 family